MHVALVGASNAFDQVNRRKRLLKLDSRGLLTYILRLLSNVIIGQHSCVRRGSTHSEYSPIGKWSEARCILPRWPLQQRPDVVLAEVSWV